MHCGNQISQALTSALRKLIISRNIDIYVVPPDVMIENTQETKSQKLFSASVGDESQTGIYGPSYSKVGLGLVLTVFIGLFGAVITASVLTCLKRRKFEESTYHRYSLQ